MREYARGFEDACEYILKVVMEARSLEEVEKQVKELLGLVKEHKFEALQRELTVIY